jgi:hypothetical protein
MIHTLKSTFLCLGLILLTLLIPTSGLQAAENGVVTGPIGAEDFMTGALPPHGFYYLNYLTSDRSGTLKDQNGKTVPGTWHIGALVDIARFVYITDKKILGADWGFQVIVPLANLNVTITTPAGQMSKVANGVADTIITPVILGWHRKHLHWVTACDFITGAGGYDTKRIVNTGRGFRSLEPAFAFSYVTDRGFEVSTKFMYDINFEHSATHYKSGQQFHTDWLVGVHRKKINYGLNGYTYVQTTNDSVSAGYAGQPLNSTGNRGQFFGIGPAIGFQVGRVGFALKYHHEMGVRNMFSGDRLWLKVILPFPAKRS